MGKYEDDLIDGQLQNECGPVALAVAVGCTLTVLCLKTLPLCVFCVMWL